MKNRQEAQLWLIGKKEQINLKLYDLQKLQFW